MDLTSANLTIGGYPCLTHFGVNVGREETRDLLSVSHIKKGVCDKTLKGVSASHSCLSPIELIMEQPFIGLDTKLHE